MLFLVAVDSIVVRKGVSGTEEGHEGDHISSSLKSYGTSPVRTPSSTIGSPIEFVCEHDRSCLLHSDQCVDHLSDDRLHPPVAASILVDGIPREGHILQRSTHVNSTSTRGASSMELPRATVRMRDDAALSIETDAKHNIDMLGDQSASLTGATEEVVPAATKHTQAVLRAWVFFAALSLHGFFDGLSLGSETDEAGFIGVTIAVVSHKVRHACLLKRMGTFLSRCLKPLSPPPDV